MKILLGLLVLAALGAVAYFAFTSSDTEKDLEETAEDLAEDVEGEIDDVVDFVDSARQDAREAVDEIDELLFDSLDDRIKAALNDVKEFAKENAEDAPPAKLIDYAVNRGDELGRSHPALAKRLRDLVDQVAGSIDDATEYLTTFVETAYSAADIAATEKLPKEGGDRFPHIGYLESQGIETYADVLEYKEDFTEIKQVGPSRADGIRQRLEDDGFL